MRIFNSSSIINMRDFALKRTLTASCLCVNEVSCLNLNHVLVIIYVHLCMLEMFAQIPPIINMKHDLNDTGIWICMLFVIRKILFPLEYRRHCNPLWCQTRSEKIELDLNSQNSSLLGVGIFSNWSNSEGGISIVLT